MTIVEFLLARITEDEEDARAAIDDDPHWLGLPDGIIQGDRGFRTTSGYFHQDRRPLANYHIARHDPARVLAECEAKRRIVDAYDQADRMRSTAIEGLNNFDRSRIGGEHAALNAVAIHLAAIHRDHPDYNSAWSVA